MKQVSISKIDSFSGLTTQQSYLEGLKESNPTIQIRSHPELHLRTAAKRKTRKAWRERGGSEKARREERDIVSSSSAPLVRCRRRRRELVRSRAGIHKHCQEEHTHCQLSAASSDYVVYIPTPFVYRVMQKKSCQVSGMGG